MDLKEAMMMICQRRFHKRKLDVESFMRFIKPSLVLNVVALNDIFGPTVTDPSIESLVVSSETLPGASFISDETFDYSRH
jgi:phosphopantetheine adenylyltransferase